ncbi:MAG: ATP-binding protein [Planctomycetota bacterium]|jgi:PAS domain S-box-containing protein
MNEIYRYRKLQQFGTLILRETPSEELENTLFELLPEVINIDAAALFIQSAGNRWNLRAASAEGKRLGSVRQKLKAFANKQNGANGSHTEKANPLIFESPPSGKSKDFPMVVAFPIVILGTISAFIVAGRKSHRAFSTDDINRLDHVAAILSLAMEKHFVIKKLTDHADHLAVEKEHLKTEVVERTRELTREREFASLLKERAPYLVFVLDKKGDVLFANPFCLEVTGYSVDELIGKNFCDLLYVKDASEKKKWFSRLYKTSDSQSFQTTLVARGGEHCMISWNAIKRTNDKGRPAEVICIGRDVTRRAHLEAHNRILLETLPDGMFRVNDRFEGGEVNKHAAEVLGVEPQSLIGRKCYETICAESRQSCPIFGQNEEVISYETKLPGPGTKDYPILKSVRRYRLGANEYTMETFKDITKLKRMEQKVRDYAENLEQKVEQRTAELKEAQLHIIQFEKLAATGRLAASIAHEINNPIYGIRGCLQSVKDETILPQDLKEYVKLSIKETDRISDLVKRMQELHKSSKTRRKLEDVSEVLKDILVLNNKFLQQKKIKLQACFEPNLPKVKICADEIKQVFINLVNNAVEAMPRGGNLTIKIVRTGEMVEILFTDTGAGIPKKLQERIFDAFFTTKSAVKGVGLGLPVCWGIMQNHGGELRVKSRRSRGSTFIMALPVAKKNGGKRRKKEKVLAH